MTVLVPQGNLPSRSDGNQEPTDLTENRIYVRTHGTFSAQVCWSIIQICMATNSAACSNSLNNTCRLLGTKSAFAHCALWMSMSKETQSSICESWSEELLYELLATYNISLSFHFFTTRSHEDSTVTHKSLLVGVVSDILISTTVGNTGPEAAYNVKLVLIHPPSLTLSRVEGGAQFICETDQTTTRTVCSTPNGLISGAQVRHNVRHV